MKPNGDGNEKETETEVPAVTVGDEGIKMSSVDDASDLLSEMRVLSNKVKSDDEESVLLDEWKAIANTFDKFFFWLFMIAQIVMVLVCFGIIPAMW